MVAGIIVVAAGDEVALTSPMVVGRVPAAWMLLGGTALFLAGHAAFKAVLWHRVSWPRIGGVIVLAVLVLAVPHVSALVISICAAAVVVAVAIADLVLV
jgi:low temperature requirement protein LtrA